MHAKMGKYNITDWCQTQLGGGGGGEEAPRKYLKIAVIECIH